MANDTEIYNKVVSALKELLYDELDESNISEQTHLFNDLDLESLDMATLFIDLEEQLDRQIDQQEIIDANIQTIGDLVQFINAQAKPSK